MVTEFSSFFGAECPDCDAWLAPVDGWLWSCPLCGSQFERCGRHLVPVITASVASVDATDAITSRAGTLEEGAVCERFPIEATPLEGPDWRRSSRSRRRRTAQPR